MIAPPDTTRDGFPERREEATLLISYEVTSSILSQYWWNVKSPIVIKFLAISSSLSPESSIEVKIYILREFFALFNSTSSMLLFKLLSSSVNTFISSAECEPGPSTVKPNKPESENELLIVLTPSTKLFLWTQAEALFIPEELFPKRDYIT